MKKVLYISNIEVPYRVSYFNELAKYCDLTVLYERSASENRDSVWVKSENSNYKKYFLDGLRIGNESSFSLKIITYLKKDWDVIVLGCFNSPIQMIANMYLKRNKVPFIINLDGDPYAGGKQLKAKLKRKLLNNGSKYIVAGSMSSKALQKIVSDDKEIIPYYFSSLTKNDIFNHSEDNWLSHHSGSFEIGGGYTQYISHWAILSL